MIEDIKEMVEQYKYRNDYEPPRYLLISQDKYGELLKQLYEENMRAYQNPACPMAKFRGMDVVIVNNKVDFVEVVG